MGIRLSTAPTVVHLLSTGKRLKGLAWTGWTACERLQPLGQRGYRGSGPLQLGPIMHCGALVLGDSLYYLL